MDKYVEFLNKMTDRVNNHCEPVPHEKVCAVSLRGLAQIRHQLPCCEPEARNYQSLLFLAISKPLMNVRGELPVSVWLIKALGDLDAHEGPTHRYVEWATAGLQALARGLEATGVPRSPVSTQTSAAVERSRSIELATIQELQRLHDEASLAAACP
ncbi:hypothetical protein OG389_01060 [Streptomyces sp. NBC_00435]|uniref:hypothetical protein n=1 Tax=Streptomyces sp. NBC_00435 TaxID=2903649 RepID=UPI002E1B978F